MISGITGVISCITGERWDGPIYYRRHQVSVTVKCRHPLLQHHTMILRCIGELQSNGNATAGVISGIPGEQSCGPIPPVTSGIIYLVKSICPVMGCHVRRGEPRWAHPMAQTPVTCHLTDMHSIGWAHVPHNLIRWAHTLIPSLRLPSGGPRPGLAAQDGPTRWH